MYDWKLQCISISNQVKIYSIAYDVQTNAEMWKLKMEQ